MKTIARILLWAFAGLLLAVLVETTIVTELIPNTLPPTEIYCKHRQAWGAYHPAP